MSRLSFRQRSRKSRNPCRAWIHPIQDQIQLCPQLPHNNTNNTYQDNTDVSSPLPQQLLSEEFKNYIKQLGTTEEPVLVIEKTLRESDVNHGLQRLLIPLKQVVNHGFLTEEERSRLNNDDIHEGIDAILIEPSLAQSRIKLKMWHMRTSSSYALVRGWNEVVKRNGLKLGQIVQLWSFKKGSQLYFVLVRLL